MTDFLQRLADVFRQLPVELLAHDATTARAARRSHARGGPDLS